VKLTEETTLVVAGDKDMLAGLKLNANPVGELVPCDSVTVPVKLPSPETIAGVVLG
jgi:hypothetical protein